MNYHYSDIQDMTKKTNFGSELSISKYETNSYQYIQTVSFDSIYLWIHQIVGLFKKSRDNCEYFISKNELM